MYIVTIKNGDTKTEVQNEHYRLFSGTIVKGINTIDSFSFSVLPDNPAFGSLHDFTTLVEVYNTNRQRYEFHGRVLYTTTEMDDKGRLTQAAVCESYLGFLCDSRTGYLSAREWTPRGLLDILINGHTGCVEGYKHFMVGQVGVTDPEGKLNGVEVTYGTTWETIKKLLLDVLGGEIRFRPGEYYGDEIIYIDYLEEIGEVKSTEIALSRNMKAIVKEKNPSSFITRLIPLGARIKDEEGNDTEQRIKINSVVDGAQLDGPEYIRDAQAEAEYGIHYGYVEFDDETQPSALKARGEAWIKEHNKVAIKYNITAVDLALLGLDVDDFDVGNSHPLKNRLLGIDDVARIIKKTIDVCDESKTSIEIGESFKSLSEIQREQMVSINKITDNVAYIVRNYVTNQKMASVSSEIYSMIEQTEKSIKLHVAGLYATVDDIRDVSSSISMTESRILAEVSESYALKDSLKNYATTTSLEQKASSILATVNASYATNDSVKKIEGKLELKIDKQNLVSELNASADIIRLTADRFRLVGGAGTVPEHKTGIYLGGTYVDPDTMESIACRTIIDPSGGGLIQAERENYKYGSRARPGIRSTFTPNGIAVESLDGSFFHKPLYFDYFEDVDENFHYTGTYHGQYVLDCKYGDWYIERTDGIAFVTSDRERKNTIEDQSEVYSRIFDRLRPVTFKYNNGTSDRLHTGLIAQEVEEAVLAEGLTTKDFAAVGYEVDENGNKKRYGLRYDELVSMCIKEIQDLKKEVKTLKERTATA